MNPDLQGLIALHRVESDVDEAGRALDSLPGRYAAIDAGLAERQAALEAARGRAGDNATARRELDKELAAVQTRLRRYKDQLMEVKTNKEYLAMQHEIATAEQEVSRIEDRLLELLLQADAHATDVKAAEAALAAGQNEAVTQRADLDAERQRLEARVKKAGAERQRLAGTVSGAALALFDHVRSRRGTALAEVRDGHCAVCHVRLRPQFFNDILKGDTVVQCESCQRILFMAPLAGPTTPAP